MLLDPEQVFLQLRFSTHFDLPKTSYDLIIGIPLANHGSFSCFGGLMILVWTDLLNLKDIGLYLAYIPFNTFWISMK